MLDHVADTHALIWYLEDSPRLGEAARNIFDACDRQEILIYVPTICLVEMLYLQEKGRISDGLKALLDAELRSAGSRLVVANLTAGVVDAMNRIPRDIVPDMPDRIIAATALHLDLPLLTRDNRIRMSGVNAVW